MSEMPAGSNFFSVIETNLGVEAVASLYERAGWNCHRLESGEVRIETDWADLILERETDDSLLLHGPVVAIETNGERVLGPLLEAGLRFKAEGYADDRRLLLEWVSGSA
jgi:hypothetical protein